MVQGLSRWSFLAVIILLNRIHVAIAEDTTKVEFEIQLAPGKSGTFQIEVRRGNCVKKILLKVHYYLFQLMISPIAYLLNFWLTL